jgi:sugar phosphate isomerase/epimerase
VQDSPTTAPDAAPRSTGRPPIARTGGARLKLSLNAFSFSGMLNETLKDSGQGLSLFDLLDFCAGQNLDGIDPTGYFFSGYPQPPSDADLNQFKRRAFELGLGISGTGVRNDFASADQAKRATDVRHVQRWIEVAARLGAPVLRVFAGPMPAGYVWDEVAVWMAEELALCADYGKSFGVLVGVQNHGDCLKSADDVLKILHLVGSEWLGAIVDTGFIMSADPYADMARLAPYAVNWQIKEKLFGKDSGIAVDMRRLIQAIATAGYRGYLPIETLAETGRPYDPRQRVAALVAELRQAIEQLS